MRTDRRLDAPGRAALRPALRSATTRRSAASLLTAALPALALGLLAGFGPLPAPLAAQAVAVDALAARCAGGVAALAAPCLSTALAVRTVDAGIGLARVGGSPLPGAASTLGKRFASTPRFGLTFRAAQTRFDAPDLRAGGAGAADGMAATTIEGIFAVGLIEGFAPRPTVGGVFAVDAILRAGKTFLPNGDGFRNDPTHLGYGVRIGVLRESFTLPGVSVSVTRTHGNAVEYGAPEGVGTVESTSTTTSLRATVGKEFLAVGVLGGIGWDRTSSQGTLFARADTFGLRTGGAAYEGIEGDRTLFFAGLTRTFLVAQVGLEGGYARGFESRDGAFDPGQGAWWGSLSFRLTL